MSGLKLRFEDLGASEQPLVAFDCGNEALTRYLKAMAGQDVKRLVTKCVVAVDTRARAVAGYYTLSASRVDRAVLPAQLLKKLPRHEHLPAALLGRLGVDVTYRGKGLGGVLLMAAVAAIVSSPVAAYAMIVDSMDAAAASFYRKHGFQLLQTTGDRMFIPMKTMALALSN